MSEKAVTESPVAKDVGADISGEMFRVYTFPGGETVRVDKPVRLWGKPPLGSSGGGSHRIALENGNGVYVPYGWIKIEWQNKPGVAPVQF